MISRQILAVVTVACALTAPAFLHAARSAALSDAEASGFPAWPPNQTMPTALPATPGAGRALNSPDLCIACLRIRVGRPLTVRGPFPDELDNPFVVLRLKAGSFRGFSANAVSYAVDGPSVWSMGGTRIPVMRPGPTGSVDECGRWITGVARAGSEAFALVHEERACDYDSGQTDKSVALAVSQDEGLTWLNQGQIIAGRDRPKAGTITGEGDCSLVDGRDGYLYAYCLRNSDWQTIVARAPLSGFGPGAWRKFHAGTWDADGLGGHASPIGFFGTTAGYLKSIDRVATVANDRQFGGLRLALSSDKAHFTDVGEPIVPVDDVEWQRPAASDLIAYVSLLNPNDGTNGLDDDFLLSYVYVPPGKTFASRYLVFQGVHVSLDSAPPKVQAAIALTRWKNADETVTSSGPVIGDGYRPDAFLGYLLTRQPDGAAAVKLEECVGGAPDHPDHLLTIDGRCTANGYVRQRTAGWAYQGAVADAVPIYRCREVAGGHFASNAPDCEGRGVMELRLGYALRS